MAIADYKQGVKSAKGLVNQNKPKAKASAKSSAIPPSS
jgi:hypothetical protein